MGVPKGNRPWNAGRAAWRPTAAGYMRRQAASGTTRRAREVMAALLGRPLEPAEHVRHRDGNRANDEPANLIVTRPGGPGIPRRALGLLLLLGAAPAHAWVLTKSVDCASAPWKAADLVRVLTTWKVPYVSVPTGDTTKAIIVYPMPIPPQVGARVLNVFVDDADFCAKWKGIGLAVDTLVPETK